MRLQSAVTEGDAEPRRVDKLPVFAGRGTVMRDETKVIIKFRKDKNISISPMDLYRENRR